MRYLMFGFVLILLSCAALHNPTANSAELLDPVINSKYPEFGQVFPLKPTGFIFTQFLQLTAKIARRADENCFGNYIGV